MFKAETLSVYCMYTFVQFDFEFYFYNTAQPTVAAKLYFGGPGRISDFWPGLSRSRVGARPVSRLCHGTVTGNPPAAQRVRAGPHSDPAQYTRDSHRPPEAGPAAAGSRARGGEQKNSKPSRARRAAVRRRPGWPGGRAVQVTSQHRD
jgi:hypothetical protein